jgi:tRNA (guanine-N7-)-methyltransferase
MANAAKETMGGITVDPPAIGAKVDFCAMFGNERPVEMEIGVGKGAFLLRQSRTHPERNYFGVEWANKIYQYAADRMRRWAVTNVRLMRTDARHLMMNHLSAGVLSALHIYHPDPWPKKRHHKRRLIQPDFVEGMVRSLKIGARLAIQTDHAEYFDVIETFLVARCELEVIPFDDPEFGTVDERMETNFEVKYLREGRDIYRLAFRRK